MRIIGLHNDIDAGICLLQDDTILEAVNEERFNRVKLYQGLPELCFQYVLKKHHLSVHNIDYVVYPWYSKQNDYPDYVRKLTKRIALAMSKNPQCGQIIEDRIDVELDNDEQTRQEFEHWMHMLGIPAEKIVYVDHHHSHAWSAFATSPFDEAYIFTFDGRGDLKSATASCGEKEHGITEYDYLLTFDSLGYLYGQITKYLGFTPHRHEGKITGLAAYGNPETTLPIFREIIAWTNGTIVANLGLYKPFFSMTKELQAKFNRFSREDIAAGIQAHCEDLVAKYISHWIQKINKPHIKNVCLAGGLFANVRINQCVREISGVEQMFVFPHMGDGGLPVGGAVYLRHLLTGKARVQFPTVYLGIDFSYEESAEILQSYAERIQFVYLGNQVVEQAVQDLFDKKVVGYFSGRMEFGPRALGARSILYHAGDKSVNDWLNKRLGRTEFMPFAPVTPVEYAAECYINWSERDVCSRFMTITYNCTDVFAAKHAAVVHIDGTARPQIVTKELNGEYYEIIKQYCDRSGNNALINTSFNAHEEPIVCTPQNAIEGLLNNRVEVLFLAQFRVTKK